MNLKRNILIIVLVVIFVLGSRQAKADFTFGPAQNCGPVLNTPTHEADPGLSRDGLFLCFMRWTLDWSGNPDTWVAQRATGYDLWDDLVSLGPWVLTAVGTTESTKAIVDTMGGVPPGWGPADDLESYLSTNELGGYGGSDLFVVKRETVDAEWGPPLNLGPNVNTPNNDIWGPISSDGLTLHFSSFGRPEGYGRSDLYVTTRETRSDPWGAAMNLGPNVNGPSWDILPIFSPDGLALFFVSGRPGGCGGDDIWVARRASLSDPWGQAVNPGATVNTSADDTSPYISPDGSTLYFCSDRPGGHGGFDIWQAPIEPLVDFDGDGDVDCTEICVMTEFWGTGDSLCDIAPPPFGDGVVDVQDLILLSEHLISAADPNTPVGTNLLMP